MGRDGPDPLFSPPPRLMVSGCAFPVEVGTASLDHRGVWGALALGGFTDPFRNLLKVLSPYPGKVCIPTNQY